MQEGQKAGGRRGGRPSGKSKFFVLKVTKLVTFLFLWGMNIYNRSSLTTFYKRHPDCKGTLEKWYHDVGSKNWKKPGDVVQDFNTARTIKNNRVIFEINHNDYRLIAEINYLKGWVFIKFIGTHAEYDKVEAETVNLFKSQKGKP
jgi:mRNA interferase HigB